MNRMQIRSNYWPTKQKGWIAATIALFLVMLPNRAAVQSHVQDERSLQTSQFIDEENLLTCLRSFYAADDNNDNALDSEEYLQFLMIYGDKTFTDTADLSTFQTIPMDFSTIYLWGACWCDVTGNNGADQECCLNGKDHIELDPSASDDLEAYLTFICLEVNDALEAYEPPSPLPTTSAVPTDAPTSDAPSVPPSPTPTIVPSSSPTSSPSHSPSDLPSAVASNAPSHEPSYLPSTLPPSSLPSDLPTFAPSNLPSASPSGLPSEVSSNFPSIFPSFVPTIPLPTEFPTEFLSARPSELPSIIPSIAPSASPSGDGPSSLPSDLPSSGPSQVPSNEPSQELSSVPSLVPSPVPSQVPSQVLSQGPSQGPSQVLSQVPSRALSDMPSNTPTTSPTEPPTTAPPVLCVNFRYSLSNDVGLTADDIWNEEGNTVLTGLILATRNITMEIMNTTISPSNDANRALRSTFSSRKQQKDSFNEEFSAVRIMDDSFSLSSTTTTSSHETGRYPEEGDIVELAARQILKTVNENNMADFYGGRLFARRETKATVENTSYKMTQSQNMDDSTTLFSSVSSDIQSRNKHITTNDINLEDFTNDGKKDTALIHSQDVPRRKLAYYSDDYPVQITAVTENPFCPSTDPERQCAFVSSTVCVVLEGDDDPEVVRQQLIDGLRTAITGGVLVERIPPEHQPVTISERR